MPLSAKVSLASLFCLALAAAGCGANSAPLASIAGESALDGSLDAAGAGRPEPLDVHPRVLVKTSLGDITIELDRVHAPLSVDNFLSYVALERYDGTIFHRVDAGFMALAGGYDAKGREIQVEFPVRNEAHVGMKNARGTVAMGRPADVIDGATSQFFFNLADNPALDYQGDAAEDYGYAVFGRVMAGLDVLDRIAAAPVVDAEAFPQTPRKPIVIESIRRAP